MCHLHINCAGCEYGSADGKNNDNRGQMKAGEGPGRAGKGQSQKKGQKKGAFNATKTSPPPHILPKKLKIKKKTFVISQKCGRQLHMMLKCFFWGGFGGRSDTQAAQLRRQ